MIHEPVERRSGEEDEILQNLDQEWAGVENLLDAEEKLEETSEKKEEEKATIQ